MGQMVVYGTVLVNTIPNTIENWRARTDSNRRPPGS